jgi:hypothetical protein
MVTFYLTVDTKLVLINSGSLFLFYLHQISYLFCKLQPPEIISIKRFKAHMASHIYMITEFIIVFYIKVLL